MKTTITFAVETDHLRNVSDSHLHALWHISQANPAPMHDSAACDLAGAVGAEIVRRWLGAAPVELYTHRPEHHYWHTLHQHGNWRGPGGTWLPHDADSQSASAPASAGPVAHPQPEGRP